MADQLQKGQNMADIGTDHGFLPIYLLANHISEYVIMADISKDSLEKAKQNFQDFLKESDEAHRLKDQAVFRLGSGLEVVEKAEVEVIAIAGMGGLLMIDLINEDFEKSCSYKKYILQPRTAAGYLRHYLKARGFNILSEQLVDEDGNICSVITAVPPVFEKTLIDPFKNEKLWYNHYKPTMEEEYPEALLKDSGLLGKRLFNERLEKLKKIKGEIISKAEESSKIKLSLIEEKISYMEEMVKKYA